MTRVANSQGGRDDIVSFVPMKRLSDRFTAETDSLDQGQWSAVLQDFADANIYQTWAYGVARSGPSHLSRLVLKRDEHIVAAVQARLAGLPNLRLGLAYIRWGPLWKRRDGEMEEEVFRQMIRAVRNEYAICRGLVVRLLPNLCAEVEEPYSRMLEEEGYEFKRGVQQYRTILMDARPPLSDLERGFHQKWRKHLNRARQNNLEIVEGEDHNLLEALGAIYNEMVDRKQFAGRADIAIYRRAQQALDRHERMWTILCKADGEVLAGALFSALGDTAVDLFRATSNRGVKTYGSYLVQWRVLEHLKQRGCQYYNLNGVNPARNPGGYQFKSQLAGKHGREVDFLGTFDSYPNAVMRLLTDAGEQLRAKLTRHGASRRRDDRRRARGGQTQSNVQHLVNQS